MEHVGEDPARAVVFTPATGDVARRVDACLEMCKRRGIEVVGVAPPGDWQAAMRTLADGAANNLVVLRRDHWPPEAPRMVVVAEHPADAKTRHRNRPPVDRRPRRI